MTENELFNELEKVNNNSTSEQINNIYNQIFKEIAHDHSGVYYVDKIYLIEKLVKIYQQTVNNAKKSILISAMLNNLYYFEPDNQNPQTKPQIEALLEKFNDENYQDLAHKKFINVAVAIIHFGEKYLLGYRNASQHQGEKYEFIGGKIEPNESPKQGLIREVFEEIGCDILQNLAIKMGVIRHDYSLQDGGDKSVVLHCFNIELNQSQFDSLQSGTGTEGQAIIWVEKADLLAKKYPLPEANARILDWLKLPNTIFISQALQSFDSEQAWVDFYVKKLPQKAVFYLRPQCITKKYLNLLNQIRKIRLDITILVKFSELNHIVSEIKNSNLIFHLSHQEIVRHDLQGLPNHINYFVSCHDKQSVKCCGELAESRSVMGCFLSPVLATPTHPETLTNGGMGWEIFNELAEMCDVPVFALGGMDFEQLPQVWQNHGFGVAGIRLINQCVT